jgi:hypothetical protein
VSRIIFDDRPETVARFKLLRPGVDVKTTLARLLTTEVTWLLCRPSPKDETGKASRLASRP